MNRSRLKNLSIMAIVCAILSLTSCRTMSTEQVEKVPQPDGPIVLSTIEIPDAALRGVVRTKDALWTIDTKTRTLKRFDLNRKEVVSTLPLELSEPRALAWDGEAIWVADNRTKMVHRVNPENGAVLRSLDVPTYADKESAVLEAAAWDGRHLWVAYFAGWSSRILRLDVETGEVVQSMFANGHPIALASDGERLLMVSYNQGRYTGVITQRTIMDDPDKMNLSRTIIGRTTGKEPVGIAIEGKYLWIADRKLQSIQKIEFP